MGIDFGNIGKEKTSTEKTIENVEKSEEKKKTVKTTTNEKKPKSQKTIVVREKPDEVNVEKIVSERIELAISELRKVFETRIVEIEKTVSVGKTINHDVIMSRFMDEWRFIYPKMCKRWKNSPGFEDKINKMNELLGDLNNDATGNKNGT